MTGHGISTEEWLDEVERWVLSASDDEIERAWNEDPVLREIDLDVWREQMLARLARSLGRQ